MIVSLVKWETPFIAAIEERLGEKIIECRTREAALQALPEAEIALILGGAGLTLDDELLDAAANLKMLFSLAAGMEKLPLQALHDRGIAVCNVKGAAAVTIAEYVLGGMLAFCHHFPEIIKNQTRSHWETFFTGEDLEGKTLLVIGAGAIGSEIGKKAKAFDMAVLGIKRRPCTLAHFDAVWGLDRLYEALEQSDYVVMITPLTEETYHLMDAAAFGHMKRSAVFINVARGDTVDEDAMIDALQNKQIAGAFLDVFHTEPLPENSPLWAMDNVVVAPHNAGLSDNASRRSIDQFCENVRRLRQGLPLLNQVPTGEKY